MKTDHLLMDNRGFFHLHLLSLIFFFLAMVGGWHIYTSYKQNRLGENMTMVLDDYKNLATQAITNAPDRQKLERNLQEITQIVSKVPGLNTVSSSSSSSKPFYDLCYPYNK